METECQMETLTPDASITKEVTKSLKLASITLFIHLVPLPATVTDLICGLNSRKQASFRQERISSVHRSSKCKNMI